MHSHVLVEMPNLLTLALQYQLEPRRRYGVTLKEPHHDLQLSNLSSYLNTP